MIRLLSAVVLLLASTALATNYYIQPGIGNDGNAGTSWGSGNSWQSVRQGWETATNGDTLFLGEGNYYGDAIFFPSGGSDWIVWQCSTRTDVSIHDPVIYSGDFLQGTWTNTTGNIWTYSYTHPTWWDTVTGDFGDGQCIMQNDTMLTWQTGGASSVTAAGESYYDGSTITVWLYGDADPNSETMVISGYPVVMFTGDNDYVELWGLDLRGGEGRVICWKGGGTDHVRFEHCHISRSMGLESGNNCLVGATTNSNHQTDVRFIGDSLGYSKSNSADTRGHIWITYAVEGILIESCYVYVAPEWKHTQGFHFKNDNAQAIWCEGDTVRFNIIEVGKGNGIQVGSFERDVAVYGNILKGTGVDNEGTAIKMIDDNSIAGTCLIAANTIVDCDRGIRLGNVDYTWEMDSLTGIDIWGNIVYNWTGETIEISADPQLDVWKPLFDWDSNLYYDPSNFWCIYGYGGDSSINPCDTDCWKLRGYDDDASLFGVQDPGFKDTSSSDLRDGYSRPGAGVELNGSIANWPVRQYGAMQNALSAARFRGWLRQ